jgi:hypothetical protein
VMAARRSVAAQSLQSNTVRVKTRNSSTSTSG